MKKTKGFTLIELLVVISIIALLLSILLPSLRIAKRRAQELVCKSNQSSIGKAALTYATENNNVVAAAELASGDFLNSTWQAKYAPYIGGTSSDIKSIYEITAYNCPSYPDKEQTQDFVINAWRYVSPTQANSELRDSVKLSNLKDGSSKIHLSEYSYHLWSNSAGEWVNTGEKMASIFIITSEEFRTLAPIDLYNQIRWLDVRDFTHLPNATTEVDSGGGRRRVARGRHKKTGTNNLFFDGHVEWLDREDNAARKWWLKGQPD